MKLKEIVNYGTQALTGNKIEDSSIKAKLLLQYILKQDRGYIVCHSDNELEEKDEIQYKQYIKELIEGKPLQYITNYQEFMKLNFYVDENVLIPQPDTEILVENAIEELKKMIKRKPSEKIRILDLCTGSGAIAISIAKYLEDFPLEIYATDISKSALKIAEKNAKINHVNITLKQSDMFENIDEKFNMIISNPPYIEKEVIEKLPKEVQNEPHIALDGGIDGLRFYKIIAKKGYQFLKEKGLILLEIGYQQKESVTRLFEEMEQYGNAYCIKDLTGNNRVIKIQTH